MDPISTAQVCTSQVAFPLRMHLGAFELSRGQGHLSLASAELRLSSKAKKLNFQFHFLGWTSLGSAELRGPFESDGWTPAFVGTDVCLYLWFQVSTGCSGKGTSVLLLQGSSIQWSFRLNSNAMLFVQCISV